MKKLQTLFMTVLVLLAVLSFSQAEEQKEPASAEAKPSGEKIQNVILIGWDGAQRNHVKECLGKNELPNLKKLIDEGSVVPVNIERITDTKAGWSQILTGYNPEKTGVFNNSDYQPIPAGYSIFEHLEQFYGKDNIITGAIIGKKGHVDDDAPQKIPLKAAGENKSENKKGKADKAGKGDKQKENKKQDKPEDPKGADTGNEKQGVKKEKIITDSSAKNKKKTEGKIIEENGQKYRVIPGKPYYNTKNGMDFFINGVMENDKVGAKSLEIIDKFKDKRFFYFIHFAEVDHSGHKHGENSKEYNDALISCDKWLGKIREKLAELKLSDNTVIYVTADHGFDEAKTAHRDAPYVFLASTDKNLKRTGERADITPTIYDKLGIDVSKFDPLLDGTSIYKPAPPNKW